ncbi:MAG TPA: tRNA (adenosine(37)-N6)-threonylcarbamoyltransferase complex transferase subunit TsaD [Solirubrobacteraceae bacterium]|jgi:N6-L-threonylcarbamoyladenine synthase|nr:tRNA (adenosine(37)-N6)-threonylcarbamoyltransferase complex transferase subunit TsaD [Solirubrobacteraceae bacterium]
MSVLALETSCDDTCAAVIDEHGRILANVISSQTAHEDFGGVVPEIASRHHLELVNAIVRRALEVAGITLSDVRLIGATQGPGLVGALLVGLSTAKALAAARELPFAPVDHLQGHVAANFLVDEDGVGPFEPPFVCLIASGGHTLLAHVRDHDGFEVLGRTLDDAAGEAFDKGARMLGLGYPGGAALERLAREGDPHAYVFPGSRAERSRGGRGAHRQAFAEGLDFSFAGLKTALLYKLRELSDEQVESRGADLAASYQAAIVDSLTERAERALQQIGCERLAVGGGVAANGPLRERLGELGVQLHVPARVLCTDNAAMIASAARYGEQLSYPRYLGLDAYATGERAL